MFKTSQLKYVPTILLIGCVLTIFFTFPFILNIRVNYPAGTDFLSEAWTYWYTSHSILTGAFFNPAKFFTQPMLYPFPSTLAQADFFALPSLLLYLPAFTLSASHTIGVNFTIFISFVLNFVSCYFCLKKLTKNFSSSLIGALIFAFSPGVIGLTSGFLEHLGRYLIPLFFLFLYNYLQKPSAKTGFFIFITYCLSWFTNIEISIFITILGIVWFIVDCTIKLINRKKDSIKIIPFLKHILIYSVIFFPILFYFFSPYIKYSSTEHFRRLLDEAMVFSAKPADFLFPGPNNVLFGEFVKKYEPIRRMDRESFSYAEHSLSPGYLVIILIIIFSIKYIFSKHDRFFTLCLVSLFFSIIFAFGPYIVIGSNLIKLPYYYVYKAFPLLGAIRTPARIQYVALFFISYIVAYGLSNYILNGSKVRKILISTLVFILITAEYLNHFNPSVHTSKILSFDLKSNPTLFLPIRSGAKYIDDSEYLIQHITNNFVSVNGSTGSESSMYGYTDLDRVLKENIFSDDWFDTLKTLKVVYIAIDKNGLREAEFMNQDIASGYNKYKNLIAFEDQNWVVLDLNKFVTQTETNCITKTINDTATGVDAFYNTYTKSLYINYDFKNNLDCNLAFINNDRYLKVHYASMQPKISGDTTIILPPIIAKNDSAGGSVTLKNKLNIKPKEISILLGGSEVWVNLLVRD